MTYIVDLRVGFETVYRTAKVCRTFTGGAIISFLQLSVSVRATPRLHRSIKLATATPLDILQ